MVIIGAGFGGLTLAQKLAKAPVEVLLVDQNNYHLFQRLLYQVATAALEPEEVAHAVRGIFQKHENVRFRMATVTGVDWEDRRVLVAEGHPIAYDYLVIAAGASTNTFGTPGVDEYAFDLKDLGKAVDLRSHIVRQFERAEADPAEIERGVLNFIAVGGGPTGVEMAGALVE
ncbi:MAG: NAD(P)/FAD-dependent oxidoreductase, partial [Rhodothermales bacterium]